MFFLLRSAIFTIFGLSVFLAGSFALPLLSPEIVEHEEEERSHGSRQVSLSVFERRAIRNLVVPIWTSSKTWVIASHISFRVAKTSLSHHRNEDATSERQFFNGFGSYLLT